MQELRTVSVKVISQLTFACSKSTIETLEKGVKYVQNIRMFICDNDVVLVFLFLTLNIFLAFF